MLLRHLAPPAVALIGLAAIIGAVTSSFSSSILSAGSMFSWNTCKRLLWPGLSVTAMKRIIRLAIAVLGGAATVMALKVQSVQALWFFTSDLVFVLLFPYKTLAAATGLVLLPVVSRATGRRSRPRTLATLAHTQKTVDSRQ